MTSSEQGGKRAAPLIDNEVVLALLIGFGLLALASIAWSEYEAASYRRALPEAIQTEGPVIARNDALIPVLEACGGAILYLTEERREAIEQQAIAFFADARQGQGYPEGNLYYRYEPWQETPVGTVYWERNVAWRGLDCMKLPSDMTRKIKDAAKRSGSYFTTKPEAALLVIPSLGLVLLSYFG